MQKILKIDTPRWALPLTGPSRYKGAWGGRGSGKSHLFAEMMIEAHIMNQKHRSVCVREIQKSLNQSVKRLLETKIEAMNAGAYFEVQDAVIKSKKGDGAIIRLCCIRQCWQIKITQMGVSNKRLHHMVKWKLAVPEIVSETLKKA